jgi:hypothetical protein
MNDITIGNQHGTPTQAQLGWFAGILEGEGSLTLNVRNKKWKGWEGIGIDLQLQIVNTDGFIIEECAKIIKGIIGTEPRIMERGAIPDRMTTDGTIWRQNKTMLIVGVSKMVHIKTIVDTIMPYMIGEKKARARIISTFVERRLSRKGDNTKNGASWYDGYDWKLVDDFYKISKGKLPEKVVGLVRDYTQNIGNNDDRVRTA